MVQLPTAGIRCLITVTAIGISVSGNVSTAPHVGGHLLWIEEISAIAITRSKETLLLFPGNCPYSQHLKKSGSYSRKADLKTHTLDSTWYHSNHNVGFTLFAKRKDRYRYRRNERNWTGNGFCACRGWCWYRTDSGTCPLWLFDAVWQATLDIGCWPMSDTRETNPTLLHVMRSLTALAGKPGFT